MICILRICILGLKAGTLETNLKMDHNSGLVITISSIQPFRIESVHGDIASHLGYSSEELVGRSLAILRGLGSDAVALNGAIKSALMSKRTELPISFYDRDGNVRRYDAAVCEESDSCGTGTGCRISINPCADAGAETTLTMTSDCSFFGGTPDLNLSHGGDQPSATGLDDSGIEVQGDPRDCNVDIEAVPTYSDLPATATDESTRMRSSGQSHHDAGADLRRGLHNRKVGALLQAEATAARSPSAVARQEEDAIFSLLLAGV